MNYSNHLGSYVYNYWRNFCPARLFWAFLVFTRGNPKDRLSGLALLQPETYYNKPSVWATYCATLPKEHLTHIITESITIIQLLKLKHLLQKVYSNILQNRRYLPKSTSHMCQIYLSKRLFMSSQNNTSFTTVWTIWNRNKNDKRLWTM